MNRHGQRLGVMPNHIPASWEVRGDRHLHDRRRMRLPPNVILQPWRRRLRQRLSTNPRPEALRALHVHAKDRRVVVHIPPASHVYKRPPVREKAEPDEHRVRHGLAVNAHRRRKHARVLLRGLHLERGVHSAVQQVEIRAELDFVLILVERQPLSQLQRRPSFVKELHALCNHWKRGSSPFQPPIPRRRRAPCFPLVRSARRFLILPLRLLRH
mmetsp:Transcript_2227/g.5018  ORF Transcript_2227/g.5018 Transcript_2227/m.5018 type:complete len:213 (+) Transcript_2227:292-930(+)